MVEPFSIIKIVTAELSQNVTGGKIDNKRFDSAMKQNEKLSETSIPSQTVSN